MTDPAGSDEWLKDQQKPLNMFELAKQWTDAIKVVGTGNAAGILAAGASFNTFAQHPNTITWVKIGGYCFFFGVLTFSFAFACVHAAVFSYDEMLHAKRHDDRVASAQHAAATTGQMIAANWLTYASAIAFFFGLLCALIAFAKF